MAIELPGFLGALAVRFESDRNLITILALGFVVVALVACGLALAYVGRVISSRQVIAQSKAKLDQALESMVSGFVLLDAQKRVLHWNRRFEEIFPWHAGTMVPMMSFRALLEATAKFHLPGGSPAEHVAWIDRRMALQGSSQGHPHEQVLPNKHHIQITERSTPEGGLVITYHDVTDLHRASAEIETLAFYDVLTGLPNRRLLMDRLNKTTALASRSTRSGALLFLDLDNFKSINDTLGHEQGDQLLQQVAQRLKACVRDADTVARLGGDEFVVMLAELSTDQDLAATVAQQIGEKILASMAQPYPLGEHTVSSSGSLGATLFGDNTQSAAELLKQADIAMYQVKSQRGNALCFFDPKMQQIISQRAQLEVDLRLAVAHLQFEVYYQPQFTLNGHPIGAEALLRWNHPTRGLLLPLEFIALAEERELILPIGDWVLSQACEQLARWQREGRHSGMQLSVNVSARQFRQPEFVRQLRELVHQTGIHPHLLMLELTESLMLDNVDDCVAKMDQLKLLGIRFSVDDFGTGYSSLAYLTRLPLDQLKIDKSFVRQLGMRFTDGVIVQTIIGMARSLGLEVIAEGVEEPDQKAILATHGCGLFQGHLASPAVPLAQLETLLVAHQQALVSSS